MTDFEMDKMYTITGREFLALLSLIPDGDEKAKVIVKNVAGREKTEKVNESQIDILKPCPFCGSTNLEIRYDERDCCYIQCLMCDAWVSTGIFEPSYEDIVELWNRRVIK